MSATAQEIITLDPEILFWDVYEPEVKTDLSSCAVRTPEGFFLFDPVPLSTEAWKELTEETPPTAIFLTSGNHQRASLEIRKSYAIPIFAPQGAKGEVIADHWLPCAEMANEIEAISLPGFAPGETAYYVSHNKTLVIGDALINLPNYGFSLLPEKYCTDPREAKRSVTKLLSLEISLLLMAHGEPLRNPKAQMEAL